MLLLYDLQGQAGLGSRMILVYTFFSCTAFIPVCRYKDIPEIPSIAQPEVSASICQNGKNGQQDTAVISKETSFHP